MVFSSNRCVMQKLHPRNINHMLVLEFSQALFMNKISNFWTDIVKTNFGKD